MTGSDSRNFDDRRQSPRVDVLERLEFRLFPRSPDVRPLDVSSGGFSVSSDVKFSVGAVHRFIITPKGGATGTHLSAKVVYCHPAPDSPTRFVSGFAFVVSTERDMAKIEGLLDSITGTLSFD